MRLRPLLLSALLVSSVVPSVHADEVSERVVRSYVRSMAILEECKLEVPPLVYVRLLDYGRDLQSRMLVSDADAQRYAEEERAAFDPATSTCDYADIRVAGVLGFVQEQSVIVGVNSGLGVRDTEAIEVLGGLFMVVATIEYCRIQVEAEVAGAIGSDASSLQERLGMSMERSQAIYDSALKGLTLQAPECTADDPNYAATMEAIEGYRSVAVEEGQP